MPKTFVKGWGTLKPLGYTTATFDKDKFLFVVYDNGNQKKRLEVFITPDRGPLQGKRTLVAVELGDELNSVCHAVVPVARGEKVEVVAEDTSKLKLYTRDLALGDC